MATSLSRFARPLAPALFAVSALGIGIFAASSSDAQTPAATPSVSVVYVDIDKTITDVDEGLEAQEKMKKEQKKRQEEIASREAEIKKMQDELEKQAKSFSKEAIEKKAASYQQALAEYQQVVVKFNKELGDKERELYDPIERRLKELLRVVANRDGYDMILSKRSVPYGRKDLDLTDKMIQEYNRVYPGKTKPKPADSATVKKPPPAPPAPSTTVAPKMK